MTSHMQCSSQWAALGLLMLDTARNAQQKHHWPRHSPLAADCAGVCACARVLAGLHVLR